MNPQCAVLLASLCLPQDAHVFDRVNSPVGGAARVVLWDVLLGVETYTDYLEGPTADARTYCRAEACITYAWSPGRYGPASRRLRLYDWPGAPRVDIMAQDAAGLSAALDAIRLRLKARKGSVLVPLSALPPMSPP